MDTAECSEQVFQGRFDCLGSRSPEFAHCCICVNAQSIITATTFVDFHITLLLVSVTVAGYAFFQVKRVPLVVISELRKIVLFIVIASLLFPTLPLAHAMAPPLPGLAPAPATKNAVIISSLDEFSPMRNQDIESFNESLMQAGYTVTYVKDGAVTVDFLTNHLNDYQVVIWRTDAYEYAHSVFWYLGQQDSNGLDQTYATSIASGWLDDSHGIIGAGVGFFSNLFPVNSLSNVKLMIILSSMSEIISGYFLSAGVKSIIDFSGRVDFQFNWVDYVTTIVVSYLSEGYDVGDAVSNTIVPLITMILRDPIDTLQIPPMTFDGDPAVTIV
jgi:hypothetical protein